MYLRIYSHPYLQIYLQNRNKCTIIYETIKAKVLPPQSCFQ
jgi:hypothetical protein